MRSPSFIVATTTAAFVVISLQAEAQTRLRRGEQGSPPVLRVAPRSFLDPGTVVPVGSFNRSVTGYGQTQSYLLSPPYAHNRERFGAGVLPDPITNGPFVGARNPFGPVDYVAPPGLSR
jgi:hypothetical protein